MVESLKSHMIDLGVTWNMIYILGSIYLVIAIIVFIVKLNSGDDFWESFWVAVFWPVIAAFVVIAEM